MAVLALIVNTNLECRPMSRFYLPKLSPFSEPKECRHFIYLFFVCRCFLQNRGHKFILKTRLCLTLLIGSDMIENPRYLFLELVVSEGVICQFIIDDYFTNFVRGFYIYDFFFGII